MTIDGVLNPSAIDELRIVDLMHFNGTPVGFLSFRVIPNKYKAIYFNRVPDFNLSFRCILTFNSIIKSKPTDGTTHNLADQSTGRYYRRASREMDI